MTPATPRRARKVCACMGCAAHDGSCPTLVRPPASRCTRCTRAADRARGTSRQRGYDAEHERRFRRAVLARDPVCPCGKPSKHADHWPRSRRTLVALGLDANDPRYGRGLCHVCHSKSTARMQPGGWNKRKT